MAGELAGIAATAAGPEVFWRERGSDGAESRRTALPQDESEPAVLPPTLSISMSSPVSKGSAMSGARLSRAEAETSREGALRAAAGGALVAASAGPRVVGSGAGVQLGLNGS